jgi:hypothetical protein
VTPSITVLFLIIAALLSRVLKSVDQPPMRAYRDTPLRFSV